MIAGKIRGLSLHAKLVLMMLFLNLLLVTVLVFLYYKTEKTMYYEFEKHIAELSKAIQLGLEEAAKSGITDEKRLQGYLKELNVKGVNEISLISKSDRILSSTNPKDVGKWITNRKKELIFKADLGEPVKGEEQLYDVVVPLTSNEKQVGYLYLSISTKDFSMLLEDSMRRRVIAAALVFAVGIILIIFLAKRYTKPIEDVVKAANRVAAGDFEQELRTRRTDEIGELEEAFNYMVGKLREERDLRQRLREAEHYAGIGQFSRSIAHEIKNPLNFISLSIDHIKEQYRPCEEHKEVKFDSLVMNIKKEILRVSRFAESFLEYGRPLVLNRRKTDLVRLLDDVIEIVSQKAINDGISFVRLYGWMPELNLDPEFIKTCLYNVIINAFDAMPGGGQLIIKAEHGGGMVTISIEDTGLGISKDKADKVFDPFYTTKAKGLGLGLAFTKRIVEEHGGKTSFSSMDGKGSTLTISLPTEAL